MAKVSGGRLVVDALKREGVEYIFSLSGGHINTIYQACLDAGIQVIDTRHEQAAAHMAEAWGKLTGKPGVCVVTAGPGFTDAVTGVANAAAAHSPMIVLAGRSSVPETERLSLQELEQIDIVRPLIKWGRVVYETRRLDEFTAMAFRQVLTGRPNPVFLEFPADVLARQVEESEVARPEGYRPRYRPGPAREALDEAEVLIRQARKPAIIAGSGAYYSGAGAALADFCRHTDIPVVTNLMGRAILPPDNPHHLGTTMGGAGFLGEADLVMVLGSRLGLYLGFGRPPLIPAEARLIQVDIEGEEIGRNRKVDVGIVGDVREVLMGLTDRFEGSPVSHPEWLERARTVRRNMKRLYLESIPNLDREQPVHPARLMREINDFLGGEAVVAADGGDTQVWTSALVDVNHPGHFLGSGNFGCLGVGIPYGLAAKLRYPEKKVLVTMGDGSAGLNIMEFHTAVRFGLPIVMVVSNDCSWGMIRHSQKAAFGEDRLVGCELGEVAYEKVVEALGGYGERVDRASDIRPALERAFASGRPACLNVYTDMDAITPASRMLAQMSKE